MTCAYCGIANQSGTFRCAGCGAHGMVAPAVAAPAPSLYEQIGRAVVDRENGNALKALARIGEREEATERENGMARWAKVAFCLILLWMFPGPVFVLMGFALMFFLWIYLPYRIVRGVLGWLTS